MQGKWDVSFSVLTADDISCRLPTTVLTVEQAETELSGHFEGYGSGACTVMGVDLVAPMGTGPLVGTAGDGVVSLFLRGPTFELDGGPTSEGLAGYVRRSIPYGGPVPLEPIGTWQATPHPAAVPAGAAEFIRIEPDLLSVGVIDSLHLTVTVLGHDRQPLATQPAVILTSSDTAVATISPTGWVHAGRHHGMFTITGQSGATLGQAVGVVRSVPKGVFIEPRELGLNRMSGALLSAYLVDAAGNQLPELVTFESTDTSVANVTAYGWVSTSNVHLGSGWIRVSSSGFTDSIPVHVVALPVTFQLLPHSAVLQPGSHTQFQLQALDSAGLPLPDSLRRIVSDNPSVAGVSPAGLVTSTGPLGVANIVATAEGAIDTARALVWSGSAPALVDSVYLGPGIRPFSVAVGSNGSMLIGDLDGAGIFLGNLSNRQFPIHLATGGPVYGVAISPDGQRGYVAADSSGNMLVINIATNQVVDSIPPLSSGGIVYSVAVSPDGHILALSQSSQLRLFDAVTLAPLGELTLPIGSPRLTFHPSQPLLYASNDALYEIDVTALTVKRAIGQGQIYVPWGSAVSADGTELYLADPGFGLRVLDLGTGRLKDSERIDGEGVYGLALSTTQNLIYLTPGDHGSLTVIDRGSRVPVAALAVAESFQISTDVAGTTAVVPSANGWVYFIR